MRVTARASPRAADGYEAMGLMSGIMLCDVWPISSGLTRGVGVWWCVAGLRKQNMALRQIIQQKMSDVAPQVLEECCVSTTVAGPLGRSRPLLSRGV